MASKNSKLESKNKKMAFLNYVEGNLLDSGKQYIAHQCNCILRGNGVGGGLYAQIVKRYPHADVYAQASPTKMSKRGSIIVRADENGENKVISMFSQTFPGKANTTDDTKDLRKQWFISCIESIFKIEGITEVAFPYLIGCGLAGGDWEDYETLLNFYAEQVKDSVKVYIYKLPPRRIPFNPIEFEYEDHPIPAIGNVRNEPDYRSPHTDRNFDDSPRNNYQQRDQHYQRREQQQQSPCRFERVVFNPDIRKASQSPEGFDLPSPILEDNEKREPPRDQSFRGKHGPYPPRRGYNSGNNRGRAPYRDNYQNQYQTNHHKRGGPSHRSFGNHRNGHRETTEPMY